METEIKALENTVEVKPDTPVTEALADIVDTVIEPVVRKPSTGRGKGRKTKSKRGGKSKPSSSKAKTVKPQLTEYQKAEQEFFNSVGQSYGNDLDPDAKKAALLDETDSADSDGNEADESATSSTPERKKNYGAALVVMTNFVVPIFCRLAIRLGTRGKKRPKGSNFFFDESEKAMLNQLAGDGAGEDILSNLPPSVIYIMAVAALSANKCMDYMDMDTAIDELAASKNEVQELRKELAELRAKNSDENADPKTVSWHTATL